MTDRVIGGAVCVRVRELRARVAVRDLAEVGVANFTNSSAVVGWRVWAAELVVEFTVEGRTVGWGGTAYRVNALETQRGIVMCVALSPMRHGRVGVRAWGSVWRRRRA